METAFWYLWKTDTREAFETTSSLASNGDQLADVLTKRLRADE